MGSILQNCPCYLLTRRKNFTQAHTLPFRKASEAGRRVKERGGRVQADKQVMKGWAEGDGRVECGPCRRDITRFAVSTGKEKGAVIMMELV